MDRESHSFLPAQQLENEIHKTDLLPEFCYTSVHREQSAYSPSIKEFPLHSSLENKYIFKDSKFPFFKCMQIFLSLSC